MNKTLIAFFLLFLFEQQVQASRCFQALALDENDKSRARLIHLEPGTTGGYRETHSFLLWAEEGFKLPLNGKEYPVGPSMATAPAIHFFFNAHQKNIIKESDIAIEMLRLSQLPNTRSTIFASGEWLTEEELHKAQQNWSLKPDKIPPIQIASRNPGKPVHVSPQEAFFSLLRNGPNLNEYLVPKNLLTLSSAQSFVVGAGMKKKLLPFQSYDFFSYVIPDETLAFEAGKASAEDTKQFPEMLHATAFAMLKEAIAFNHPLNKVRIYVHSPDEAHHRLYEFWGLKNPIDSNNDNGHRLYSLSLEEMLELKRFDPAKFSEKIALAQQYSERSLSPEAAQRLTKSIRDSMMTYLDTSFAKLGDEGSRIRIDDRSPFLFRSLDTLIKAYGIDSKASEYTHKLNKIRSARYMKKIGAYLPEEFNIASGQSHVFIQELSEKLAIEDSRHLAKSLSAIAKWYSERMKPFANFTNPLDSFALVFTVITPSKVIAQQGASLGLSVRNETLRPAHVANHSGEITFPTVSDTTYYSISVPFNFIRTLPTSGDSVQQGHWAIQSEIEDPLFN